LIAALRKLRQQADALGARGLSTPYEGLVTPQLTMVVLITVLLAILLATYDEYGFINDEFRGFRRAQRIFAFFASGATTGTLSDIDVFHGAAPDVLALALQTLIPPLSYDSRHLVSALFGIAGIYYTYRFGSKFVGQWIGVFAALFLATTPLWFGYMFISHKDIPFATLLLASSYYSLLALTGHPTSRFFWPKTGLAIGLLASIKVVGVLVLVFVVTVFVLCLRYLQRRNKDEVPNDFGRRIVATVLVGVVGSLICFLFFWPQVYANFGELIAANKIAKHQVFHSSNPFRHFFITMPLYLLVLGTAGVGCDIYRQKAPIIASLIVLSSFLLLAKAIELKSARHLLFVYPFFMILAAYPVSLMLDFLKGNLARLALIGVVSLCIAGTIVEIYRLFPYQYSFYNSLVGGFRGPASLARDQGRSAEREALDQIAAKINVGTVVRIYSCGSKLNIMSHPGFERTDRQEDADYVIALRHGCSPDKFEGLPVVGEVGREGVLLARIYTSR
jgi:hypothetical protein